MRSPPAYVPRVPLQPKIHFVFRQSLLFRSKSRHTRNRLDRLPRFHDRRSRLRAVIRGGGYPPANDRLAPPRGRRHTQAPEDPNESNFRESSVSNCARLARPTSTQDTQLVRTRDGPRSPATET